MVYRRRNNRPNPDAQAGQEPQPGTPAGQDPQTGAGPSDQNGNGSPPDGQRRQNFRRGRRPYRGGQRPRGPQDGAPGEGAIGGANGGTDSGANSDQQGSGPDTGGPYNGRPVIGGPDGGQGESAQNEQRSAQPSQGQNRHPRRRGRSGNRPDNRTQNPPVDFPPDEVPTGPDFSNTNLMPYDGMRLSDGREPNRSSSPDKRNRDQGRQGGRNQPGQQNSNRQGQNNNRQRGNNNNNRRPQGGENRPAPGAPIPTETGIPKAGKEHIPGPQRNHPGNRGNRPQGNQPRDESRRDESRRDGPRNAPRNDSRNPQRNASGKAQRNTPRSGGTYSPIEYRERRERGSYYDFSRPEPTVPIHTDAGIKSRSQRGAFSQNWWARRWIEAMERLVDPGRLQRGRHYARTGQVLSLVETQYGVEGQVQGSRPTPYDVTIQVTPLTDEQWDRVIDALSEQALFTAQLLAGEMPSSIEDAFQAAGVSLFPSSAGDLFSECSCPDWANPCKHVAATHYILGDRFDDDPFLLFRMRGRSQEQILQALRARRAGLPDITEAEAEAQAAEEQGQPLEDLMDHFWDPGDNLDTFPLTIRPSSVDMPLLQRLGEPAFLGGESLQSLLKPVYDIFTRSALRAAYSEEEPEETNNGHSDESS
jgi:uncharacterized Zn finger protein